MPSLLRKIRLGYMIKYLSGENMEKHLEFDLSCPVQYRWSGKYVGKDAGWQHMERQLVDYELIVMEKGTLYIEDEWERYEVKEGQYLLMEPTDRQRGYRPSKCRFYWMHFLPGRDRAEVLGKNRRNDEINSKTGIRFPKTGILKNIDRIFVLMKQLQDSDLRYMDPMYNGYLASVILEELANQCDQKGGKEEDSLRSRVDEFILNHMSENLSVGELAGHFGYHEKYFSALFKENTGQSVKKYTDARKMERAKYLLLNTDAMVGEIAGSIGFEDVQNFYHVFKKYTECTPTEFREQYCKKKENNI